MIRLTCTSCKTTLEMDEAFAGGVCRCQHCGTIQTVPSHLKSRAGAVPQPTTSGHASGHGYEAHGHAAGSPSGLDELADVVSSGLSSSGLTSRRPGNAMGGRQAGQGDQGQTLEYRPPEAPASNSRTIVLIAVAGGLLLVVAVLGYMLLSRPAVAPSVAIPAPNSGSGTSGNTGPTTPANTDTPEAVAVAGPHFASIPLSGSRIVYVLDRGSATKTVFDPLKLALEKSLRSLGPDKEFQVIFWKRATDPNLDEASFPVNGVAKATADQVDASTKKFEDLTASGATELDAALRAAVSRAPSAIVLATPKDALQLSGAEATVQQALAGKRIKVHTISLGGENNLLKTIAALTGGTYAEVSDKDLGRQ